MQAGCTGAVLYPHAKGGGAALAGWHLAWKNTQTWPRKILPPSSWGLGEPYVPTGTKNVLSFYDS